jgi:hypothetical protein
LKITDEDKKIIEEISKDIQKHNEVRDRLFKARLSQSRLTYKDIETPIKLTRPQKKALVKGIKKGLYKFDDLQEITSYRIAQRYIQSGLGKGRYKEWRKEVDNATEKH